MISQHAVIVRGQQLHQDFQVYQYSAQSNVYYLPQNSTALAKDFSIERLHSMLAALCEKLWTCVDA